MIDSKDYIPYNMDMNSLYRLREILNIVIQQSESGCRKCCGTLGEMLLTHSADKTLAPAGSTVTYSAVLTNGLPHMVSDAALQCSLPECCSYVAGSMTLGFEPVDDRLVGTPENVHLGTLEPGATKVLRFELLVDKLADHNPVEVSAKARCMGRLMPAPEEFYTEPLRLWITDRSCRVSSAGVEMADAVAQWSLAQLFGMPEKDIGALLEYMQNNKDDILSGFYAD